LNQAGPGTLQADLYAAGDICGGGRHLAALPRSRKSRPGRLSPQRRRSGPC